MSATVIDRLRRRAKPTKRDVAALEARRAWEVVRTGVTERADTFADLAGDQLADVRESAAHQLADARKVTGKQLKEARKAAAPRVGQLRDRAVDLIDPVADRMREELTDLTATAGRELSRLALDVRDASRTEADRIIQAFHASAEDARVEERRGRVRALIGWAAFGLVAGALLARELEQRKAVNAAVEAMPAAAPSPGIRAADGLTEEQRAEAAPPLA